MGFTSWAKRRVEESIPVQAMEFAGHGLCSSHIVPYTQTSGLPQGLPLFLALVENEVSDVRINVEVNQPVVRSPGWTGLIYTALVTTPVIKSEQSSNADAVSHQLEHLSISGRKLHLRSESAACP